MFKKFLVLAVVGASTLAMAASLVETTKLQKGEVNPLQEFVGTVSFDKSSVLAAQNSGIVKKVMFEVGDKVEKNKLLVKIDSDLLSAQINAAKANLAIAKDQEENSTKDYNRYKELLKSKSITQKEYDDALLKLNSSSSNAKALEARLKELNIQLAQKNIKAPYTGTVVEKRIDLGEWANAGTPVAKIVDTSVSKITFNVPVDVLNGLKTGDIYDITIANTNVKAKLDAVIPNGDKLTRTFPVKFKADTSDIFVFEGQQAKVALSKNGKKEALILPRDSVIQKFGQNVVFTVNDKSMAVMIPVQIVGFDRNKVAIAGQGLVPGMPIVVKGNERIFPNMPVQIINK